jgi:hypothetical protein
MLYTNTNENLKITSMNLQKGRTKKVEKWKTDRVNRKQKIHYRVKSQHNKNSITLKYPKYSKAE